MSLTIDLAGRKAVVSGVSSGTGAATATALAQAGCDVAGRALDAADANGPRAFIDAVKAAGWRALYEAFDLSRPEMPAAWVDRAAGQSGGIDLLVGCAGRNVLKGVVDCTGVDWAACLELDVASHWRLAKAAYPHLLNSAAALVLLISSNHAYGTIRGCFPYNVAKSGVHALVQSLAIEWGPKVRAVGVAPGFIDTPGNDAWFASFPDPPAERRRTEARHPIGRLGTPVRVGALCAFLASEHAAFINGTVILADGGRSALLQDA